MCWRKSWRSAPLRQCECYLALFLHLVAAHRWTSATRNVLRTLRVPDGARHPPHRKIINDIVNASRISDHHLRPAHDGSHASAGTMFVGVDIRRRCSSSRAVAARTCANSSRIVASILFCGSLLS